MSKQTVDEFIIELGFSEKVLAGLAKVEKQVIPIAKRIEDRLNKAFKTNGQQQMQKTFTRIVKDADAAGRRINKSLTQAFDIKNAGRVSMRGFEKQSSQMARRIAKEIQKAYSVRAPRIPPVNTGGGRRGGRRGPEEGEGSPRPPRGYGGSGRNTANWIESHLIRNSDNGMTNSMAALGMNQQRMAMRAELRGLADKHRNDSTTHEYERAARQVIFGYKQQVAAQRAANRAMERGAFMQHSLENSTLNLVKGFASIYTALDFFKNSLQEGAKRTQAHTMALVAYGGEKEANRMTLEADRISNAYGLDTLTTRQQIAQMRMTMPKSFDNDKISKLFENESVFAHTTGMTQDAVGRLNYAMQQIAASPKLMGQDWLQVVNASPALVAKMVEQLGAKDARDLKDKAKTMTGAQFVEEMMKAMESTDKQRKMAQENIIAAQGRLNNAVKAGQNSMFVGMEKGVRSVMESLTSLLLDSSGNFERLGETIGYIGEKLTPVIKKLDEIFMNMDGYLTLFEEKITDLRKSSPVWDKIFAAFDSIGGAAIDWIAVITAIKLLSSFAGILTRLMGLKSILSILTGGKVGAGAAEGGAGGAKILGMSAGKAFGIAAAVEIGTTLGDLIFDKWVPQFQKFAHKEWGWGGKDGTETTHGGNTIKDSPVDKVWSWLSNNWKVSGGLKDPALAGYNPYAQPQQKPIIQVNVTIPDSRVKFDPIELRLPDGTIQRVAMDTISQQHELQMMSATGLAGGWQSPGQNAGWNPSLLKRTN